MKAIHNWSERLERWKGCGRRTDKRFDHCWAYYRHSCDASLASSALFPTSSWAEKSFRLVKFSQAIECEGTECWGIWSVQSQSEDQACKLKSKRPLDDVSNENEVKKTRTTTSDVDVSSSDSAVPLVTIWLFRNLYMLLTTNRYSTSYVIDLSSLSSQTVLYLPRTAFVQVSPKSANASCCSFVLFDIIDHMFTTNPCCDVIGGRGG